MVILKKGVLFLCSGNSCRSQMAEGFVKKMLSKDLNIFSAGLEPKGIHPMAVKVMQEIGLDISRQKSKNISEIPIGEIDIVITLCGDACFSRQSEKDSLGVRRSCQSAGEQGRNYKNIPKSSG